MKRKCCLRNRYTYNYDGEIIFVKRTDAERLPQTVYQPKFGTKLKPTSQVAPNTIHKIPNKNLSQEEIIQEFFKKPPEEPQNKKVGDT